MPAVDPNWAPAPRAAYGVGVYPMFEALVTKMRGALARADA